MAEDITQHLRSRPQFNLAARMRVTKYVSTEKGSGYAGLLRMLVKDPTDG